MTRPALLLSAAFLAACSPAMAQAPAISGTPPSTPAAPANQLDRIEQKLDEVLRRLDQPRNQPSGALQAGSVSSGAPAPAPGANGPPAAFLEAYRPGGLVVVRAAPRDPNGLSAIPADGVGGFVYTGGPIPLNDIGTRGVRYTGPVGVEVQGWLRAKEAGRYQLAVDVSAHLGSSYSGPTCFLQAWLENRSLDQRTALVSPSSSNVHDANATLVLGAELQPGLYRLRAWTVCTGQQGITSTVELLLKAPSELNLRPVAGADLLHREG